MIESFINAVQHFLRLRTPDEIIGGLLIGRERVILIDGPAETAWLANSLTQIICIAILMLIAFIAATPIVVLICLAVSSMLGLYILFTAVQDHYTRYVVTTSRIIYISGVLDRSHQWIPWAKVTDLSLKQSWKDRILNVARVRIESANEQSPFAEMTDLSHPDEFMKILVYMVSGRQGSVSLPDNLAAELGINGEHLSDEEIEASRNDDLEADALDHDLDDPADDVAPGDRGDAALFD